MKEKCFKVTIALPDSDDCSDAYGMVIRDMVDRELNDSDDLPGEPWGVAVEPIPSSDIYEKALEDLRYWAQGKLSEYDDRLLDEDDPVVWGQRNGIHQALDRINQALRLGNEPESHRNAPISHPSKSDGKFLA